MKRFGAFLLTPAVFFASLIFCSFAEGSEQMRSGQILESGKIAVTVSNSWIEDKDLEFRLGGTDLIQVPLSNGTTAQFFSDSNTDLKFDAQGQAQVLRLSWRPNEGLTYIFKAGTGSYELKVPSSTVVNKISSTSPGFLWGFEVGWSPVTDTPVTPAVGLALGYTQSQFRVGRLKSGNSAPAALDQKFYLEEWQAGLTVSKRWGRIEPYGGLKLMRQTAILQDEATAEKVRGTRDGFSPFAGFRWEFFPREMLVVEVFGMDQTGFALGLAVGF